MCKDGARNEDVTAFRHVLVEFDRDEAGKPIPKEEQYRAIIASGLPVAALIDSGNKSLHAWIRVDAPDESGIPPPGRRDLGLVLRDQPRPPEPQPVAPVALPGRLAHGRRRVRRSSRCWPPASVPSRGRRGRRPTPAPTCRRILPGHEFMAQPEAEPPQLVEGVLHQGAKMVLGGPSKARKSWCLIDLMLSVSTGAPWWGFPTAPRPRPSI